MSRKIIIIMIIFSFFIPIKSNAFELSKINKANSQHVFYFWQCTFYVAQYKFVNWWWSAKDWIKNASKKWRVISKNPKVWSIVQFTWYWYNKDHWHVAIVRAIKWDYIIISEMNYRRLNEITYRYVNINNKSIDGYIL